MVEDAEVNHSGVTLPVLLRVGKNSCRARTPATRCNGPRVADEKALLKLELSQARHRHRTADRHGLGCERGGTDEAGRLIPRRTAAAPRFCGEPGTALLRNRYCPHAPRPRGRAKAIGRSRELGGHRRARMIAGRSLPCLRTGRRFDHVLSLHGRGARPAAGRVPELSLQKPCPAYVSGTRLLRGPGHRLNEDRPGVSPGRSHTCGLRKPQ